MITRKIAILKFLQAQELYAGSYPTIGEISKALKLPRTTVHRILQNLCGLGLVVSHQVEYRGRFCWKFEATLEGWEIADSQKALPL